VVGVRHQFRHGRRVLIEFGRELLPSLDRRKNRSVHGERRASDRFLPRVLALCVLFNNAYLGWESNGPGTLFTSQVKKSGYRNVYYSEKSWDKFIDEKSSNPGWHSNKENKQIVLGGLRQRPDRRADHKPLRRSDRRVGAVYSRIEWPNHSRAGQVAGQRQRRSNPRPARTMATWSLRIRLQIFSLEI
jgi:hypothetical protein